MSVVLTPSGGDDTALIQGAINALPTRGGDIVLTPGTYNISDTIKIGDGASPTLSTRSGVRIKAEGACGPALFNYQGGPLPTLMPPVVLNWTAGAGKPMVQIQGPMDGGWSLEHLCFYGNAIATMGLNVVGACFGDSVGLTFHQCITGLALTGAPPRNAQSNLFRNTTVWMPDRLNCVGISLDGAHVSNGTNSCYNTFLNTNILMVGGPTTTAIYFGVTDTNIFIQTHLIGAGVVGAGVVFDYLANPNFGPNSNGFLGIDGGGNPSWSNKGTPPAGAGNNWIRGFDTGNGQPSPVVASLMADGDLYIANQLSARAKTVANNLDTGMTLTVKQNGVVSTKAVRLDSSGYLKV